MSQFFVLDYLGGATGVPPYVDGVIEEYVEIAWNEFAPDAADHYKDQTPLNLRTKHRLIDFDYGDVHRLFLASDRLLELLKGSDCAYVTRPLRVWAGKKECTQKKWFLVHVLDRLWCMDTEQSEFQVNRDPKTGELRYRPWDPGQRTYRAVYKLVIDESKTGGKDLFYCQEAFRHIVSRLAPRLQGLKGVRLTPTPEYQFPLVGEKIIDRG